MKLAHDWRAVLRHAWSVRMIILAGLFSGVELESVRMRTSPFFCGLNLDQESALCFAAVLTRASEIQAGDRAA